MAASGALAPAVARPAAGAVMSGASAGAAAAPAPAADAAELASVGAPAAPIGMRTTTPSLKPAARTAATALVIPLAASVLAGAVLLLGLQRVRARAIHSR
jgi:hypothetical protein